MTTTRTDAHLTEISTTTTVWLVRDDEGRVMDVYDSEAAASCAISQTISPKQRAKYSIQGRRVKTYTER